MAAEQTPAAGPTVGRPWGTRVMRVGRAQLAKPRRLAVQEQARLRARARLLRGNGAAGGVRAGQRHPTAQGARKVGHCVCARPGKSRRVGRTGNAHQALDAAEDAEVARRRGGGGGERRAADKHAAATAIRDDARHGGGAARPAGNYTGRLVASPQHSHRGIGRAQVYADRCVDGCGCAAAPGSRGRLWSSYPRSRLSTAVVICRGFITRVMKIPPGGRAGGTHRAGSRRPQPPAPRGSPDAQNAVLVSPQVRSRRASTRLCHGQIQCKQIFVAAHRAPGI